MAAGDLSGDQGVTDPEPAPVGAEREKTPYHDCAAPVGKVFFDFPESSMACSGTVVKDPENPGSGASGRLAGPRLGKGAQGVFTTMSEKSGGRWRLPAHPEPERPMARSRRGERAIGPYRAAPAAAVSAPRGRTRRGRPPVPHGPAP
ncbi:MULTISPECIES: hypothetical protein [unclassified Streptomyces]|uniref:hypothetical protein n=1 Tax=unclassified Streptomyces TaxID=2593676 RepID=UPI003815C1B4